MAEDEQTERASELELDLELEDETEKPKGREIKVEYGIGRKGYAILHPLAKWRLGKDFSGMHRPNMAEPRSVPKNAKSFLDPVPLGRGLGSLTLSAIPFALDDKMPASRISRSLSASIPPLFGTGSFGLSLDSIAELPEE
jgi:hypothetical protein